jgi:putative ATPase
MSASILPAPDVIAYANKGLVDLHDRGVNRLERFLAMAAKVVRRFPKLGAALAELAQSVMHVRMAWPLGTAGRGVCRRLPRKPYETDGCHCERGHTAHENLPFQGDARRPCLAPLDTAAPEKFLLADATILGERRGATSPAARGGRRRYGQLNTVRPIRSFTIDLFQRAHEQNLRQAQPLAARMRPRSLDEFVGQEHFLGPGKLLRRLLQADRLGSVIFYGPPGSGKTALAHVIANHTQCVFRQVNAVATGIKEVRDLLAEARVELGESGRRTILFVDELHRFNRAQQDVLLPDVEEGRIILIGATTQNPFFAINSPLLSRSQIFMFEPLTPEQIKLLLRRALEDTERGLGKRQIHAHEDALDFLAEICDGDARRALSALEVGVLSMDQEPIEFTREVAQDSIQRKAMDYDATGDAHYDVASAFIKSMRGSDPDAAIYWLARMLESGEDPRFIARRIVICASEDVGNADPQALLVATAAMQAVEFVGLPECQLNLAQAVTYVATAPKSNASMLAILKASDDVRSGRTLPVPAHLRDAHYRGAQQLGHGKEYHYSHDYQGGWVDQAYLPEERRYYEPVDRGYEAEIRKRMDALKNISPTQPKEPSGAKPPPKPDHKD